MISAEEREQIAVEYDLKGYSFDVEQYFPPALLARLTDLRVQSPDIVAQEATARKLRRNLTLKGRLVILAADHPARMVTSVGQDPLLMGDRLQFLGRIMRVLTCREVDGVMGTPDVIDEIFLANYLYREATGASLLDERLLIGSMNRGGLAATVFEMDDTMTGYSVPGVLRLRLDGAKVMFRLDPNSVDSAKTIVYCAEAIRQCGHARLPIFVEAYPVELREGTYRLRGTPEALVKVVGVAAGLGDTSAYTWLKLPYMDGYEKVARATTCPILLLGGPAKGDPTHTMREFYSGLQAGPNVRGALVGRNALFPGADDPRAAAAGIAAIVHQDADPLSAVKLLAAERGKDVDFWKVVQ